MILKIALSDLIATPLQIVDKNNQQDKQDSLMVRTAAGKMLLEPNSEQTLKIEAEIKKHPRALFFRSKAIKADEANTNGDYFSEDELLKSYKSFEGVPFFTNHDNQDVEKARGKIIFAEWVPAEKAVYTVSFIDRDAYPHICRSIEEEYVTGVSMGCSVEYSECNICGNVAEKTEDFCTHIKNRKGRKFSGKARHVKTGEIREFKDQLVFEFNHGIKFIELSAVVDPACPECRIQAIIPNTDYLLKAARIENEFRMVREAAIEKKASKEEIDQVEQAVKTLEDISVNLIRNRKQVEVEFASELVEILSKLQTWLDELIGAGYANLQVGEKGVPGTVGNAAPDQSGQAPANGEQTVAPNVPQSGVGAGTPGATPTNVSETSPVSNEPVGTISGNPANPPVKGPKFPISSPVRPKASSEQNVKISDTRLYNEGCKLIKSASVLSQKITLSGDDDMAKRRTSFEKQAQKENTKQILSESWKGKQQFSEYISDMPSLQEGNYKLSVKKSNETFIIVAEDKTNSKRVKTWIYEDLTQDEKNSIKSSPREAAKNMLQGFIKTQIKKIEGANKMSDIKKNAGVSSVNTNTDVITERQLDEKGLFHPRTGTEVEEITQAQLESLRKNTDSDVVTERQLDDAKMHPRTENAPDVVTEAQMDGDNRTEEEQDEVTQAQLDKGGKRTGVEQDEITEKQLSEVSTPWARTAKRDASLFKSASAHMDAVIDIFAETAIETGSTPDELQAFAHNMTSGIKARYDLVNSMLEKPVMKDNPSFAKKASYWSSKNVRIATASTEDVLNIITNKLRVLASDTTINPETVVDAMDILAEEKTGLEAINAKIDQKVQASSSKKDEKASIKSELRQSLANAVGSEKKVRDDKRQAILASIDADKIKRQAERDNWNQVLNPNAVGNADTIIQTTFDESGIAKTSKTLKKDLYSFAKTQLTKKNVKLASITNVTISGDTIQIAVQTDSGEESVNIPIGDKSAPVEDEIAPEADLSGEGLENNLGAGEGAAGSSAVPAAAPAATAGAPMATASTKKTVKLAQTPAGAGVPGAAGGVSSGGAPEQGLSGNAPTDQKPVEALMSGAPGEGENETDIPTVGEKQMPWTICPECGASDTDVQNDDTGNIKGTCNSCGCKYEAMVKKTVEFKLVTPTESKGEEGEATPAAPEVPALPVAASVKLDKGTILRMASNQKAHGHVCPACGGKHCSVIASSSGHTECECGACQTKFQKDVFVNEKNKDESYMAIQWDLTPDLRCPDCAQKAMAFASKLRVGQMLRTASENGDSFPMANCMERVSREFGGDTVGTFGPCKGKLIANCICKQLKTAGLSKVRQMKRLASVSLQKDPMDECIKDQMKKSYSLREANTICGCIKKKFASNDVDNIWIQAFADDIDSGIEKTLRREDLDTLNDSFMDVSVAKPAEIEDEDLGDALPPPDSIEIEVEEAGDEVADEVITCPSCGVKICEKCGKCCDGKCESEDKCSCQTGEECEDGKDSKEGEETAEEVVAEDKAITENVKPNKEHDMREEDTFASMNGQKVRRSGEISLKLAGKPTKVESIEGNVEAGVPRKESYLGKEKAADSMINKNPAKPNVPRGEGYMGKEKEADSLINKPLSLPDVPVDHSYIGKEEAAQKGMPAINNDIKGTVIADTSKATKMAKKLTVVDTVEKDADVPRGKATMGNEGADNIDVKLNDPKVPRGKATMGNEGADNIDVKAEDPDVPMGDAYMGGEKDAQKGMPANNDEYLKNVKQSRDNQMDRIANARREEARDTASWLLANKRIASDRETFDNVVKALCAFEVDKIKVIAESMFPMKKTASTEASAPVAGSDTMSAIPAVVTHASEPQSATLANRLASAFTIGNKGFDDKLTMYGIKQ